MYIYNSCKSPMFVNLFGSLSLSIHCHEVRPFLLAKPAAAPPSATPPPQLAKVAKPEI